MELSAADEQVLRELTERARTDGLKLTGEGGLLGRLTKMILVGADQSVGDTLNQTRVLGHLPQQTDPRRATPRHARPR